MSRRSLRPWSACVGLTLLALAGQASAQSRDACAWQPGFGAADLDGSVRAMTVFDDGSGPALYVAGWFTTAGELTVNHIARWDGTAWSGFGGPSGPDPDADYVVQALAVFDDGSGPDLYAGGYFPTAGGVTANNIARWDGATWSALSGPSGTGTSYAVQALKVFDDGSGPALYVAGKFTTAGGVTANYLARWDGTAWSPVSGPYGTGMNGYVYSLAVFDDGSGAALYAGGSLTVAGGLASSHIAAWGCFPLPGSIFADDFENGDTTAWSLTVP